MTNTTQKKFLTDLLAMLARGPHPAAFPFIGSIPAGTPSQEAEREEACQSVDVDSLRLPNNPRIFALKVRGNSMINAGIRDGDIALFEFREPRNRDIVAALIDGECTLKRYVVHRGRTFLKAENPKFPDLIPAQELVIQGVQVALVRFT